MYLCCVEQCFAHSAFFCKMDAVTFIGGFQGGWDKVGHRGPERRVHGDRCFGTASMESPP